MTAGGRVLCATALGNTVAEAQAAAYELASQISLERHVLPPRHRLPRDRTRTGDLTSLILHMTNNIEIARPIMPITACNCAGVRLPLGLALVTTTGLALTPEPVALPGVPLADKWAHSGGLHHPCLPGRCQLARAWLRTCPSGCMLLGYGLTIELIQGVIRKRNVMRIADEVGQRADGDIRVDNLRIIAGLNLRLSRADHQGSWRASEILRSHTDSVI